MLCARPTRISKFVKCSIESSIESLVESLIRRSHEGFDPEGIQRFPFNDEYVEVSNFY